MMKDESKDWFVSTSDLAGQEIITRGRRHLTEVRTSGQYTDRVEIEWNYEPLANGMPSAEQDKFMNEVAFKLSDAMEAEQNSYLTALYTGRAKFIMVFYTSDINQFAVILHQVLSQYEQLPLEIGRIEDASWSDYTEMLQQNGMTE